MHCQVGVRSASAEEAAAQAVLCRGPITHPPLPHRSTLKSPQARSHTPIHSATPNRRWESGQRLLKKLLLKLYSAAGSASGKTAVEGACAEAGGVNDALTSAFRNILSDASLDGTFKVCERVE